MPPDNPPTNFDGALTIDDVASRLGITRRTASKLVEGSDPPLTAYLIGGRWRITPEDLALYVLSTRNRQPGEAHAPHHVSTRS